MQFLALALLGYPSLGICFYWHWWRCIWNCWRTSAPILPKRGIIRPVVNLKNMDIMTQNAQNCLAECRIEPMNEDAARRLIPNLSVPLNLAFYMPEALNVNTQKYLEGLYLACENLANESGELRFHQKSVQSLLELAGEYEAVIICCGARAACFPELSGKLPLRACRGIVAQLQLGDDTREEYPDHGPSILSDAWLPYMGPAIWIWVQHGIRGR